MYLQTQLWNLKSKNLVKTFDAKEDVNFGELIFLSFAQPRTLSHQTSLQAFFFTTLTYYVFLSLSVLILKWVPCLGVSEYSRQTSCARSVGKSAISCTFGIRAKTRACFQWRETNTECLISPILRSVCTYFNINTVIICFVAVTWFAFCFCSCFWARACGGNQTSHLCSHFYSFKVYPSLSSLSSLQIWILFCIRLRHGFTQGGDCVQLRWHTAAPAERTRRRRDVHVHVRASPSYWRRIWFGK